MNPVSRLLVQRSTSFLGRSHPVSACCIAGLHNTAGLVISGVRGFSGTAAKVKYEDLSLEGRYSGALMNVCLEKGNMDKVFDDLSHLRQCYAESNDFRLFVESPAIQPQEKEKVIAELGGKYGYDAVTTNYLKCLLENRRLGELKKMIDNFENFYRAQKGEVMCTVTSVTELSSGDQAKVEKALSARAQGSKIMVNYTTNDALLGGLVVKMGEQVLDFSVSSRLDRLQAKLMAPV